MRTTPSLSAVLAATALVLAACGGGDDDAAVPATTAPAVTPAEQPADPSDVDGSTVREGLGDAIGESGDLDAALNAMSPEARFEPVADQLEPRPDVQIDGTSIRLVFDGSSVENATFDCIVGGAFVNEGETLTVVYPDGEQTC